MDGRGYAFQPTGEAAFIGRPVTHGVVPTFAFTPVVGLRVPSCIKPERILDEPEQFVALDDGFRKVCGEAGVLLARRWVAPIEVVEVWIEDGFSVDVT